MARSARKSGVLGLTRSQFAKRIGVHPAQAGRWIKLGMPIQPDGRIDPAEAEAWLTRSVDPGAREAAQARRQAAEPEEPILDLSQARARLATAQYEFQEMKNARLRGELLPRSIVERYMAAQIASTKSKLLAIPTKGTPILVGMSNPLEVHAKLTDLVHEALRELSAEAAIQFIASESAEQAASEPGGTPPQPNGAG
jgi:phage terminase Nu1 subunit (DNA packaging protein)